MVVHRVAQWLRALLSPHISRNRPMAAGQREPLLVGVTSVAHHTPVAANNEAPRVLNWLAASRRLRPPRTISIAAAQAPGKAAAKGGTTREQVAAACPRPQPADERPKRADTEKPQAQQPPAVPQSQPLRREPAPVPPRPPVPAAPPEREDYATRRRLLALKHLVRMGVYSEGFMRHQAPEQYRRSLGLDDDDADDLGAIE